jgi:hypothetical protein
MKVEAVRDDGALLVVDGDAALVVDGDSAWATSRDSALARGDWRPATRPVPAAAVKSRDRLAAMRDQLAKQASLKI